MICFIVVVGAPGQFYVERRGGEVVLWYLPYSNNADWSGLGRLEGGGTERIISTMKEIARTLNYPPDMLQLQPAYAQDM